MSTKGKKLGPRRNTWRMRKGISPDCLAGNHSKCSRLLCECQVCIDKGEHASPEQTAVFANEQARLVW